MRNCMECYQERKNEMFMKRIVIERDSVSTKRHKTKMTPRSTYGERETV